VGHALQIRDNEVGLLDVELGQAIEAMPDGIAIHDGKSLRYVNPALAESLGFGERDEVLTHPLSDFLAPEQRERAERSIARLLAEGGSSTARDYRCRRVDGGVVNLSIWGTEIRYCNEPAVLLVIKNLSAKETNRRQLYLADRMATLGLLAAGVAHEINNPLTYLALTLAQLSRRLPPNSHPSVLVGRADDALVRIRDLVATLRTYAGSPTAPPVPISVNEAIDAALQIAAHRLRGRARLVRDFGEVPAIMANEAKIVQVFVNLLVNAADAIPPGDAGTNEVRVRTNSENGHVTIEVSDTGRGMSAEVIEQAFEVFFTTKPPGEGTGLGLPLSKEIVESLGGTLTVRSREGEGTTVRVVLPATNRDQPAPR